MHCDLSSLGFSGPFAFGPIEFVLSFQKEVVDVCLTVSTLLV
jgi:hypothetical protein